MTAGRPQATAASMAERVSLFAPTDPVCALVGLGYDTLCLFWGLPSRRSGHARESTVGAWFGSIESMTWRADKEPLLHESGAPP